MSIVIVAEHAQGYLSGNSIAVWHAACRLRAMTGLPLFVWVLGEDCVSLCEQAQQVFPNASEVWQVTSPALTPQVADRFVGGLRVCLSHSAGLSVKYLLMSDSSVGKDVLPRLAGCLGVAPVTDVIEVVSPHTFVRPIYAGNARQTVTNRQSLQLLTIRSCAFSGQLDNTVVESTPAALPEVRSFPLSDQQDTPLAQQWRDVLDGSRTEWVSATQGREADTPDLSHAEIVVAGGRGLQSKENFNHVVALAKHLGAAVGATRAAVDAGFAPNACQVGQTGKVIAPRLYIAVGISGAIQHLAGIQDSQCIVAINTDVDAPIFQVADYRLVADALTVLPEWYNTKGAPDASLKKK